MTEPAHTLFSFMVRQAVGIPNGNHGSSGKYNIDSVTLNFSPAGQGRSSFVLIPK